MPLKTPILIVNFKAYEKGTGPEAVHLAKICDAIAKKTKESIAIAVEPTDIFRVQEVVSIPVFAQHIDPFDPGSHTGSVTAEAVKDAKADGTLINHFEKRISLKEIKLAIEHAKKYKLTSLVCSPDNVLEKKIIAFKPDFIAVEPPELIGGKISVSTAKPELIKRSFDVLKKARSKTKLIVGAGIQNKADVAISLKLGAVGVLVASAVVQAKNPKKVLLDLVSAL
mgnify:CR=1 FL=1